MGLRWATLGDVDPKQWADLIRVISDADGIGEYYEAEDLAEELADANVDVATVFRGWVRDRPAVGHVPAAVGGMKAAAWIVRLEAQLHRGVNGLDFVRRFRGSGPGIAVLTSSTKRRKPISADSNRADFALAA